ncbi:MAG: hypothetical protein FJ215_03315 [Ignavibacteria bacterium]|nr:hypothetical protein [Ignavibacteria bacterium]
MPISREEKHQSLVTELCLLFTNASFDIIAADGVEGYSAPMPLENRGYGDQQQKTPDVYGYDRKRKVYVIGEAKTGDDDLETEHALTQYNVYLDQPDPRTGKQAFLYVILPANKVPEFNTIITHYLHPDYWPYLVVVSSLRWPD